MFAEGLFDFNRGHIKKKLCNYCFAEIFKDDFVYAKVFAIIFYIHVYMTLLNRKDQLR
jgi:hypothetical protein